MTDPLLFLTSFLGLPRPQLLLPGSLQLRGGSLEGLLALVEDGDPAPDPEVEKQEDHQRGQPGRRQWVDLEQGDQIGRTFAYWMIVNY
jgi:hypothetical protein